MKRIRYRQLAPTALRTLLAFVIIGVFATVLWKEGPVNEPGHILPAQGDPQAVDGEILGFDRKGNAVAFRVRFHTGTDGPHLVQALMNGRVVGSEQVRGDGLVKIRAVGRPVHAMLAEFDRHYAETTATWISVENMPGELDVEYQANKWALWRRGKFTVDPDEANEFVSGFVSFRRQELATGG